VEVVGSHCGSPCHVNERPGRGQIIFNGLACQAETSVNFKASCVPNGSRATPLLSCFVHRFCWRRSLPDSESRSGRTRRTRYRVLLPIEPRQSSQTWFRRSVGSKRRWRLPTSSQKSKRTPPRQKTRLQQKNMRKRRRNHWCPSVANIWFAAARSRPSRADQAKLKEEPHLDHRRRRRSVLQQKFGLR
jgi:hypothetical protein